MLSRQRFANHFPGIDRRPFATAIMKISQREMIDAHQGKNRRVNVVDMAGPLDGTEADFVGGSDD